MVRPSDSQSCSEIVVPQSTDTSLAFYDSFAAVVAVTKNLKSRPDLRLFRAGDPGLQQTFPLTIATTTS